jgi:uncharacterized cupredoxin-like copper-binding protein
VVVVLAGLLAYPAASGAEPSRGPRGTPTNVTLRDFTIKAPLRLPAGGVVLRVSNVGPDDHELLVVRKGSAKLPLRKDGLTVDEERLEDKTAGVLEAGVSGSVRRLRLRLRPGHYELFCNMSGHYLGGMKAEVEVKR